jgi:hypothetical protein
MRCGSVVPHDMHNYTRKVELACEGVTACGTRTHAPHMFDSEVTDQCEGICKCAPDKNGYQHSPGYHK